MRPLPLLRWLLLAGCGVWGFAGDLVVVVNASSGVERLTRDEVINLFMGRTRKLATGLTALPIDQGGTAPDRARFYRALVGKELPEINAYWARLIFSGQAFPPRQAESEAEVLEILHNTKGAIAYVDRKLVDRRLRIVFEVGP
ncbi:MAG TPA: hypothetical protein VJ570_10355 [Holophagaceae bacterium]|nr:hypothetical protein [Holophagaceae bacterium]